MTSVPPFSYYDVIDVFESAGCAICNLLLRDTDRFIDSLLYEYSNKPDIHRVFRDSRGLCNEHSWRLMHYKGGGALNITVLYAAAVDEILKAIRQSPVEAGGAAWLNRLRSAGGAALADQLEPRAPCMVCESLAGAEKHYIQTIGDHLDDSRLQNAYRASDGLCLPHFRLSLRQIRSPKALHMLTAIQTEIWQNLQSDLEKFKDEYDINRAEGDLGDAGDSWRRAIGRLSGEKGVFGRRS